MLQTTLTVNVTQEDIQNGKPGSASDCAVAIAIVRTAREIIDDTACSSVGGTTALVWGTDSEGNFFSATFPLPEEAVNFIDRIDDGKEVAPFTFTVGETV